VGGSLSLTKSDLIVISVFSVFTFIVVFLALLNAGAGKIFSLLASIACVVATILIYFGFTTKPRRRM
jgi:hypothetical protein